MIVGTENEVNWLGSSRNFEEALRWLFEIPSIPLTIKIGKSSFREGYEVLKIPPAHAYLKDSMMEDGDLRNMDIIAAGRRISRDR
jgi:hypothetical protein